MEYADQLRTMALRLSETNQSLITWGVIAAQRRLAPGEPRQDVSQPRLSRRALKLQLIMLLADMSRLEQEISAGAVFTRN